MKNKILNEDFRTAIKSIGDNSIDLIVTDPPYKITSRGNSGGTGGMLKTKESMNGNVFSHNSIEIEEWISELHRVLKEGSHIYIMCNNKNLSKYLRVINDAGFNIFKTLIWAKNTAITNMYYMDSHEYIIFARKGKAKKINNCGTKSVLEFDNPRNKLHPTEKPVELIDVLIKNSSNEGDLVFDPFMGSSSVALSSIKNNRNYIGFEIDENYYKISLDRIKEYEIKR